MLIPFEGEPGTTPRGFSPALTGDGIAPVWILRDGFLVQTSEDPTDYRFPHCVRDELVAMDVNVSVRWKPLAGKVDQAGGLVLRWRDENHYYLARGNALENNVRFYKVLDGRRRQLEGRDLAVAPGAWHSLAVRAQGTTFTVTFDGETLFSVTDESLRDAGKIGVWTKSDSVTAFDALACEPLSVIE